MVQALDVDLRRLGGAARFSGLGVGIGVVVEVFEKGKHKAQLQEANKKKIMKRVERKMAAVARERAWAKRLDELNRIKEEKKIAT
ncbi:hypothetical protein PHJA_000496000 [Phtheirospermum japonicum]|uniref:Uncharacterized protein n=1 Tax=Phtheirospermum japonicum TaxID=374723 RepID=A0A830B941_9LAMI|nr:hypothetical protein PHJA_000496000 [Phtheirospermum japonicum]